MNKKILFILLALVVVIFVAILAVIIVGALSGSKTGQWGRVDTDGQNQGYLGIANPASVYCEEKGGILEVRDFIDGQKGFCLFEDGSECDEWKFFRNECQRGTVFCKDFCGDGTCQQIVCMAVGCPCAETIATCSQDCSESAE